MGRIACWEGACLTIGASILLCCRGWPDLVLDGPIGARTCRVVVGLTPGRGRLGEGFVWLGFF